MKSVRKPWPFKSVPVRRAIFLTVTSLLICFGISYLDQYAHSFDYLEESSYGDRLEVDGLIHPHYRDAAQKQIEVITISDDTYKWASHGGAIQAFIPRNDYAILIDKLTSYGAKAIVFDMLFDTRQQYDDQMAASIRKANNVVLACASKDDMDQDIVYPNQELVSAGCRIGHTKCSFATQFASIDDIEPVMQTDQGLIPALSVEAARVYNGTADLPITQKGSDYDVPNMPMPTDVDLNEPSFKIRFVYGQGDSFPELPFESIIAADAKQDAFYEDSTIFRNKIVVIGDTTKINNDSHLTPIGTLPGVVIQANAMATLLQGRFVHQPPPRSEFFLTLLLVVILTVTASVLPLRYAIYPILSLLPAYFVFNIWLFVAKSYYLHLIAPAVAIIITALVVLLERAWAEESEKSRMRGLLQRYVNPRIADHILKHPEIIGGSGKREYGTILFSDIRGFTKLSEELSPEELIGRMNEYFQVITEIVFRHDGTAASIVGDALLAVFGIPVPTVDHADRAVAAAIEIQAAVKALGRKWSPYSRSTLESGIGINTGEIIVGEVGGKHLRNFTVYGLNVNIAARVEATNKDLMTNILITRSTHDAMKRPVKVNPPVSVRVKGVLEPIDVFEVVVEAKETAPVSTLQPNLSAQT